MGRRIVEIVELCEHGERVAHFHPDGEYVKDASDPRAKVCVAYKRRTLTEGEYVLKVDGGWPEEAVLAGALAMLHAGGHFSGMTQAFVDDFIVGLDAVAGAGE